MNAPSDQQLLQEYTTSHSETAFAGLVRRHIELVHSAARRMVCDSHQAEDVTQNVFVALAQNAPQLIGHPVLSGWLHRTTRNLAANTVRTNVRRQKREQQAVAMNELLADEPDDRWKHIAPQLDAALDELSEPDRDALLLRYFERKSAREMAQTLSISDEAAQKRVTRAVDRLRERFAERGVTVGATGLVAITANAVHAAPAGLATTISSATAAAGTTLTTTATGTSIETIAMTTLQKTLATVTFAALAGVGFYQAREASHWHSQHLVHQQQHQQQLQHLQSELQAATDQAAKLKDETTELSQLRNEVQTLREQIATTGSLARKTELCAMHSTTPSKTCRKTLQLTSPKSPGRSPATPPQKML